jgi:hypothetical protein
VRSSTRAGAEIAALLERDGFDPATVRQAVDDYPAQVPSRADGRTGQSGYHEQVRRALVTIVGSHSMRNARVRC